MVEPVNAAGRTASQRPGCSGRSLAGGWMRVFGCFHQKGTQQSTAPKSSAFNPQFLFVHLTHQASHCSALTVNRVLRIFSLFCAITCPAWTLRRFLIECPKSRGGGGYPLVWLPSGLVPACRPLKATGAGGRAACAPVGVHGVHGR
jgi:hypothetical protein